mmetsp:Transcript_103755/g.288887  ORF Transcript_103755/g.288887 Transcript_103755/m.288887 type:complete len:204 (+) Transcript_103755:393-1004(+)
MARAGWLGFRAEPVLVRGLRLHRRRRRIRPGLPQGHWPGGLEDEDQPETAGRHILAHGRRGLRHLPGRCGPALRLSGGRLPEPDQRHDPLAVQRGGQVRRRHGGDREERRRAEVHHGEHGAMRLERLGDLQRRLGSDVQPLARRRKGELVHARRRQGHVHPRRLLLRAQREGLSRLQQRAALGGAGGRGPQDREEVVADVVRG